MNPLSKKEIRDLVIKKRDRICLEQRAKWDEEIYETLINSEFYKNADVIFTFVSFKSEVDTHRFINHGLEDNKIICVPRVPSKQEGIEVYRINSFSDLHRGYFGILEPAGDCRRVDSHDIGLILMPGLAFDRKGGRIGYGGGFYDRFIGNMNREVVKLAIAYHFQIIDDVPVDEHDIRVDGIITDEDMIIIKGRQ